MLEFIPFTYLIGWSHLNKFYYGRRTAKNCHPDQLWTTYFTSSKEVRKFRKEHGEPDIVTIRQKFPNDTKACIEWESKVLKRIDAQHHSKFLNLRNGDHCWDTTGMVNVKNVDGEKFVVSINDPKYLSGELIPLIRNRKQAKKPTIKNTVTVKDADGNTFRVSKDDDRYLTGELVGVASGFVPVKDSQGNSFHVKKDDPRLLNGDLVHVSKGVSNVKCKGMVTVRGPDGTCFNIPLDDPRYISGELVQATKGKPSKLKGRIRGDDDKIKCPHCNKEGGLRIMKRWHFDSCKLNVGSA